MSSEALAWAFKLPIKPSSVKFTLVALCECANYQTGRIFPSIEHICQITGQDRKTVIANISKLIELGYIIETGERVGSTRQIKVYQANIGTIPKTEQSRNRNSTEFPDNSTEFPIKESQKRDTEPSREPSINPQGNMSSGDDQSLENEIQDVVRAWNELADERDLPKITKVTPTRRKQIVARLKEYDVDDWSKALTAIYRSKFLCGENDRGWKANFDFLLQPSSFVKLIEGAYNK